MAASTAAMTTPPFTSGIASVWSLTATTFAAVLIASGSSAGVGELVSMPRVSNEI